MGRLLQVAAAVAFAFLLLIPFSAYAKNDIRIADFGRVVIYLGSEPCKNPDVLRFIENNLRHEFKEGAAYWPGMQRVFALCYVERNGRVGIIDEAGDSGITELDKFEQGDPATILPKPGKVSNV